MSQGCKPLCLKAHCCHSFMYSFGKHVLSTQVGTEMKREVSLKDHNAVRNKCTLTQVKCETALREVQMPLVSEWKNH